MQRARCRPHAVEQFVNEPPLFTTLHLKACLLPDSQQGGVSDAFNLWLWGKSELRESGNGAYAALSQRLPLIPRDSRDERQVVVRPAAGVTQREPRTHLAVLHGFGVGVRFELPRSFELASRPCGNKRCSAELGIVREQPCPRAQRASTGAPRLEFATAIRIKAKLNQCGRLGGACELGFHDLVRPRPEGAGLVDPNKEVRPPAPRRVQKRGLIDGIDAFAQCSDCLRNGIFPTTVDVDLRNRETVLLSQFPQVSLLVLKPQLSQQINCSGL